MNRWIPALALAAAVIGGYAIGGIQLAGAALFFIGIPAAAGLDTWLERRARQ